MNELDLKARFERLDATVPDSRVPVGALPVRLQRRRRRRWIGAGAAAAALAGLLAAGLVLAPQPHHRSGPSPTSEEPLDGATLANAEETRKMRIYVGRFAADLGDPSYTHLRWVVAPEALTVKLLMNATSRAFTQRPLYAFQIHGHFTAQALGDLRKTYTSNAATAIIDPSTGTANWTTLGISGDLSRLGTVYAPNGPAPTTTPVTLRIQFIGPPPRKYPLHHAEAVRFEEQGTVLYFAGPQRGQSVTLDVATGRFVLHSTSELGPCDVQQIDVEQQPLDVTVICHEKP